MARKNARAASSFAVTYCQNDVAQPPSAVFPPRAEDEDAAGGGWCHIMDAPPANLTGSRRQGSSESECHARLGARQREHGRSAGPPRTIITGSPATPPTATAEPNNKPCPKRWNTCGRAIPSWSRKNRRLAVAAAPSNKRSMRVGAVQNMLSNAADSIAKDVSHRPAHGVELPNSLIS
jgi:hypothetical protein